ncbi:MAG: hypothetical protein KBC02_02555 [Candidatus Pacebacteria bacterium]|nr:hypothetical protein [Candidatus Paceibacterota bacterium]
MKNPEPVITLESVEELIRYKSKFGGSKALYAMLFTTCAVLNMLTDSIFITAGSGVVVGILSVMAYRQYITGYYLDIDVSIAGQQVTFESLKIFTRGDHYGFDSSPDIRMIIPLSGINRRGTIKHRKYLTWTNLYVVGTILEPDNFRVVIQAGHNRVAYSLEELAVITNELPLGDISDTTERIGSLVRQHCTEPAL